MIDPVLFHRAELEADLQQLRTFAQAGPGAAERVAGALHRFAREVTHFVEALPGEPAASPRALLLAAGEAQARLEELHHVFDSAMDHLERLPVRLELGAPRRRERLPEDPRPEGVADAR